MKEKINKRIIFEILAIVLIAIFCISLTPKTLQNDTFYTIKIGEHIIQEKGIDMIDPFSWHENLEYTYPHWLYDVIIYGIYSIGGMTGIYISTCIFAIILGITVYIVNSKLARNQVVSFFITIGVMYLIRGYICARAQLVTFILFILTIYFIEQFLETKKKRYVIGLIIIPILIANLHVAVFPFYFVLYMPYIAQYLIAILAETVFYRKIKIFRLKNKIKKLTKKQNNEKLETEKQKLKELEEKVDKIKIKRTKELENPYKIKLEKNNNVKWLIIIMIICLLTGFLTPLGTTPYTYLIKTMQGNTTQNINEHLPMTLSNDKDVICTLVIFLAILVFTKSKIRMDDLIMLGGLTYLMLSSRRQVTMFAIIGSVILNRMIISLTRIYDKDMPKRALKVLSNKIGILVLTVVILALSMYFAKDKFDDKYIDDTSYPVAASDYILENIDLGTARFYNEYNYGSYMLFRGIPVFIDSRADLYAPEFSNKEEDIFSDFIDTSSIGKFYEDIFKKYQIKHVITYANSKMNMIITKTKDPNYKELYKDDYFVVYERINV